MPGIGNGRSRYAVEADADDDGVNGAQTSPGAPAHRAAEGLVMNADSAPVSEHRIVRRETKFGYVFDTSRLKGMCFEAVETKRFQHGVKLMSTCTALTSSDPRRSTGNLDFTILLLFIIVV